METEEDEVVTEVPVRKGPANNFRAHVRQHAPAHKHHPPTHPYFYRTLAGKPRVTEAHLLEMSKAAEIGDSEDEEEDELDSDEEARIEQHWHMDDGQLGECDAEQPTIHPTDATNTSWLDDLPTPTPLKGATTTTTTTTTTNNLCAMCR